MRAVLTWLMVFCVLAGIHSRVLSSDAEGPDTCSLSVSECCPDVCEAGGPDETHHDGDNCPPDHHHHPGCCFHAMPLTVESDLTCRLGVPGSSLTGIRHEGDVPPEEPFLSSEKPPLI